MTAWQDEGIRIRRMVPEDYEEAYTLWEHTPGMHLHSLNNTYGGIALLLAKNPDSCFVAVDESGKVIATALGATDGRKGYLYHVAVDEQWRGHGIGTTLINRIYDVFKAIGIIKIGIMVVADNIEGQRFWKKQGWKTRPDVIYFDRDL
ncbi:GNAT family N-acetyltransferase [Bifidobacterium felsineum]|uniref:GNAT family N-acetyltransferase n=1 Tax=Bifidobacterium felsineum TaxID=2045440 RepID=UPI001BDCCDB4|nr:GNAT family N-acetyltransferase [Bifidobacterium felsineum]MBT1164532.1 GNAT family N-acetyltransferase [Bifidobacterium felsineum]